METLFSPDLLTPALAQWAFIGVWLLAGLSLYAAIFDQAVFEGLGRVPAHLFGSTDAGIAAGLITLFLAVIAGGMRAGVAAQPETPALPKDSAMIVAVVVNSAIFLTVMFGILVSLSVRRVDWQECFGFRAAGPLGVLGRGALLLLLALPIITVTLGVSHLVLGGGGGDEQEIVRFFVGSKSTGAKLAVALSAMVLAPLQEEFVFRGYLYPVLKRYGGPFFGLVINAALFAGIHLHLPSFAGLFVLAACLTLAYEWTGSLLVPMTMHALFNSLTVVSLSHRG